MVLKIKPDFKNIFKFIRKKPYNYFVIFNPLIK